MKKLGSGFHDFVVHDLFSDMPEVHSRRMFGGWGIYQEKKFFGIISEGKLYFKTSDFTRGRYIERGMKPFAPSVKQVLKNYYEVPEEVLENREELVVFAREAAQQ
ncbi:MAG: TfoX/Sxy family protein [Patescibacteria group bacterium]